MKILKKLTYLFLLGFVPALSFCTKEVQEEIVISLNGLDVDVDYDPMTKATAVTSLANTTLYWGATTGGNAAGSESETVKYATSSGTSTSASKINTGKYQTASATSYNWYVSNVAFTTAASSSVTVSNNGTDVVVGRLFGNSTASPAVTLNHIFARLCSVTVQAAEGYTVSSITATIVPNTSGVYNMRSLFWTSSVAGSSTSVANSAVGTKANDIYLVPGDYTVTLGWTAVIGNYTKTFSSVQKTVTLVQNRTNNLTVTLGGDAEVVTFTTSLTDFNAVNGGTLNLN